MGLVSEDIVPLEAYLGAAYRSPGGLLIPGIGIMTELTPELKLGYADRGYGDRFFYSVGMEGWMFEHTFALRTGINNNEFALGASFEKIIGIYWIRIDYALVLSFRINDNFGSHKIATSFEF